MQSTGHSSIQALSLMSTQGSAIVYVTECSSSPLDQILINGGCPCVGACRNSLQYPMWTQGGLCQPALTFPRPPGGGRAFTDTRRCIYKCLVGTPLCIRLQCNKLHTIVGRLYA